MTLMKDAQWRASEAVDLLLPWAAGDWPGHGPFMDSLTKAYDEEAEPFDDLLNDAGAMTLVQREVDWLAIRLDGALTIVRDLIDQQSKATGVDRADVLHQLQRRYRQTD